VVSEHWPHFLERMGAVAEVGGVNVHAKVRAWTS